MDLTENARMQQSPLPADSPGRHRRRLRQVATVVTFGAMLFGYDTGVINGALGPMKTDLGLTALTEGIVVSILVFGAAFGAVAGGPLSDKRGRRFNLIALSGVFIVGTIGCVLSPNWELVAASRFVLGFAVGASSATVPIYLSEIALAEKRGRLVLSNEAVCVTSQFVAFVANAVMINVWGEHQSVWRYMIAIGLLPAFGLLIGMLRSPESPRWLVAHDRNDEALSVLLQLRSPDRAQAELKAVQTLVEEERRSRLATTWKDLTAPWVRRLIVIGALLGIVQQLTGVNAIMYYGTQILQDSGFSANGATIANAANGLFSVAGVLTGIALINKVPRRVMLMGGLLSVIAFHVLLAASDTLLPETVAKQYLILGLLGAAIFAIQAALGPLVWVVLSEIFPLKVRNFAMGICVTILWLASAGTAFAFPPTVHTLGIASTFLLFAGCCVIGLIFVARMVPETQGRSLEEFEASYKDAHS